MPGANAESRSDEQTPVRLSDHASYPVHIPEHRQPIRVIVVNPETLVTASDPIADPPALTDFAFRILEALKEAQPQTLVAAQLAQKAKCSERTVLEQLAKLEQRQLVHRPEGKNSGWSLTSAGQKLLAKRYPSSG